MSSMPKVDEQRLKELAAEKRWSELLAELLGLSEVPQELKVFDQDPLTTKDPDLKAGIDGMLFVFENAPKPLQDMMLRETFSLENMERSMRALSDLSSPNQGFSVPSMRRVAFWNRLKKLIAEEPRKSHSPEWWQKLFALHDQYKATGEEMTFKELRDILNRAGGYDYSERHVRSMSSNLRHYGEES